MAKKAETYVIVRMEKRIPDPEAPGGVRIDTRHPFAHHKERIEKWKADGFEEVSREEVARDVHSVESTEERQGRLAKRAIRLRAIAKKQAADEKRAAKAAAAPKTIDLEKLKKEFPEIYAKVVVADEGAAADEEPAKKEEEVPPPPMNLKRMTVPQLDALAEEHDIDLSGCEKKADKVAVIETALLADDGEEE